MLKLPKTQKEWIIATASALTGFFFGGAVIAATQKLMRKALY